MKRAQILILKIVHLEKLPINVEAVRVRLRHVLAWLVKCAFGNLVDASICSFDFWEFSDLFDRRLNYIELDVDAGRLVSALRNLVVLLGGALPPVLAVLDDQRALVGLDYGRLFLL